jgi:hypothetical protein
MATSLALAFISSGGDRALRDFQKNQAQQNAPPPLPAPPPTP